MKLHPIGAYLLDKFARLEVRRKSKKEILSAGGEQARSHSVADIRRIDRALGRIVSGTYGHCLDCGVKIEEERLEIIPEAELCIECQRAVETGLKDIRFHHPNRYTHH